MGQAAPGPTGHGAADMQAPALSFGAAADLYDSSRPGYPTTAISWALDGRTGRVLDLAAGTGLLTITLLSAGHEVVCVDPDLDMLRTLAHRLPEAEIRPGSAERIPLATGSVDAVVVGQAYHWFNPPAALAEIHRVLRPNGVFSAMWNYRDERVDWVSQYAGIVGYQAGIEPVPWSWGEVAPWFDQPERAAFMHTVGSTPDGLLNLLRSRSNYLTANSSDRADMEARVAELTRCHRQLAGRDEFDVPYRTWVFRMHPVAIDPTGLEGRTR